jgi:hypothetical protein
MKARFPRVSAGGLASADIGTPEQKRACTPDLYRLCAGEIPNARAITACLRPAEGQPQRRLPGGIRAVMIHLDAPARVVAAL